MNQIESPNPAESIAVAQRRICQLREVIAWSFQNGGLSTGERICINQEIAGLMCQIDALGIEEDAPATYTLPQRLAEKVAHIVMVIANTGWIKKELIKY